MDNKKIKLLILLVLVLALIISCIRPLYPREMYLQHSAMALAMLGAILMILILKIKSKKYDRFA